MTSSKAERQRRYIARINADPQKREEFLIKDRLRKKNMAMTHYETKHDYRKKPEVQRMQLNNKSNAEFLNQALTYRGYKQIEKPTDAIAQSSLGRVITEIFHAESISEDLKAELCWLALRHYNNDVSKMFEEEKVESNHLGPVLSPSTPSPPLLTSAQQKRHRYKQRESTPPQLASTAELKRRRQRWESAAKNNTRKLVSWEVY